MDEENKIIKIVLIIVISSLLIGFLIYFIPKLNEDNSYLDVFNTTENLDTYIDQNKTDWVIDSPEIDYYHSEEKEYDEKSKSCPLDYSPVCGIVDGNENNFENRCMAEAANAIFILNGVCIKMSEPCPSNYSPVCGIIDGNEKTFENRCMAEVANAIFILNGVCISDKKESKEDLDNTGGINIGVLCTLDYSPVCGIINGEEKDFGNRCMAESQNATNIKNGICIK